MVGVKARSAVKGTLVSAYLQLSKQLERFKIWVQESCRASGMQPGAEDVARIYTASPGWARLWTRLLLVALAIRVLD